MFFRPATYNYSATLPIILSYLTCQLPSPTWREHVLNFLTWRTRRQQNSPSFLFANSWATWHDNFPVLPTVQTFLTYMALLLNYLALQTYSNFTIMHESHPELPFGIATEPPGTQTSLSYLAAEAESTKTNLFNSLTFLIPKLFLI